jgi:hypothetical protein
MTKINVNGIAADLEACRCVPLGDALDEAGMTIADLRRELELARALAEALAVCVRDAVKKADGLRLERDVAQQEAAERTAERDALLAAESWEAIARIATRVRAA